MFYSRYCEIPKSFRDHLDTFKIPYSESDKTWDIVWDNSALCCQSGETYVFSTLTDHFYKTPLLIDEITDAELWIKLNSNLAQKLGWS